MTKQELATRLQNINEELYYLCDEITQIDDSELTAEQEKVVCKLINKAWDKLAEASYDLIYRKYQ